MRTKIAAAAISMGLALGYLLVPVIASALDDKQNNLRVAVKSYPPMARTTGACLSASWGVDIDGGAQGLLLAADGGVPDPTALYVCTATGDGCFQHASQPHVCSFAARFFASGVTFENFPKDPNDAGAAVPRVFGVGIGGATVFDCCPYVAPFVASP